MRFASSKAARIALALLVSGPVVAAATPAAAHTPSNCTYSSTGQNCLIYNKWQNNRALYVAFHTSVGVGSWIEYFAQDAWARWYNARADDEPGTPVNSYEEQRKPYTPFTPCTVNDVGYEIGVASAQLDSAYGAGVAGITLECPSVTNIHVPTTASIVIDTDGGDAPNGWFLGTGQPPAGGGKKDLWSVIVHEWGHAVGYGPEMPEGEVGVCRETDGGTHNWAGRNTMCSYVYFDTNRQRTLASHDIYHFQTEY